MQNCGAEKQAGSLLGDAGQRQPHSRRRQGCARHQREVARSGLLGAPGLVGVDHDITEEYSLLVSSNIFVIIL